MATSSPPDPALEWFQAGKQVGQSTPGPLERQNGFGLNMI